MSWRRSGREDLPLAGLWALGTLCVIASLPLLPVLAHLAGPCPLRTLAGIPCFTCGATRAATALGHGHVVQALAFNPLAAMLMSVGLVGGPVAPAWVLLRGPLPTFRASRGARILVGALLLANWLYLVVRGV